MTNIFTRQNEIIEEFKEIEDWRDRYRAVIEYGRDLPKFPEEKKSDNYLIRECQNRAWVLGYEKDGYVYYLIESEAQIVRGLAAILIKIYSGSPPDEILNTPATFVSELGLGENLTRNRVNGLAGMVTRVKQYALSVKLTHERVKPPKVAKDIIHKEKKKAGSKLAIRVDEEVLK
jgi:cysteine desulfuration protein SufE